MKTLSLLVALLLATIFTGKSHAEIKIVTTIKPLHSLVANITNGVTRPQLLLKNNNSPHGHALKPSSTRLIARADIIFWMGPEVESFLTKPLMTLPAKMMVVSFSPGETGIDPHIWLNPISAIKMAKTIASTLSEVDPQHAEQYQNNLAKTILQLNKLDTNLKAILLNSKPIVVFHNAYSHLAERYHLNIVGVLVENPELSPGAKNIKKIIGQLNSAPTTCIFAEFQFNPKIVKAITSTTKQFHSLDPLGSNLTAGPEHYFKMMHQLADTIANCR